MVSFNLSYSDNKLIKSKGDAYLTVDVQIPLVLESWKISLFSFEWLTPDGKIRALEDLPEIEQEKYSKVLNSVKSGEAVERPILGIGIMDNVEIGSRRDVLLTIADQHIDVISVHIPKMNEKDFMPYI